MKYELDLNKPYREALADFERAYIAHHLSQQSSARQVAKVAKVAATTITRKIRKVK